ncbi:MAG TPA: histidinol phosphate phosphatase domain-containing protein [Nitrospinota bacterium]|jgi:histidinol phosphatase-like PHP family hydrolase|nr:histidinol phosphate phosphatase domain-containing protein [Nitrospinota bacterium]
MIDLHMHSFLSDGVLTPSELARRCDAIGFTAIAITDHVDSSNIETVVPQIVNACNDINKHWKIKTIPGFEITHTPIEIIGDLVKKGRALGAKIALLHGETVVEPVIKGTNHAGLLADIDILAHPGVIDEEDAKIAAEKNIYLEISGRKGHSFTNGHVVKTAQKTGAPLIFNTDTHAPGDLMSKEMAELVLIGSGLSKREIETVFQNAQKLVEKKIY